MTTKVAAIEEWLRGETSVFPRWKGFAPWNLQRQGRIDLVADEASLRAKHLAQLRFQPPDINSLKRPARFAAPVERPPVLFRQIWEVLR